MHDGCAILLESSLFGGRRLCFSETRMLSSTSSSSSSSVITTDCTTKSTKCHDSDAHHYDDDPETPNEVKLTLSCL